MVTAVIRVADVEVPVYVTTHARERWIERVQPGSTWSAARAAMLEFVGLGSLTRRSPRWMRAYRPPAPLGCRYALNPTWPRIALLVADDGAVISVMTDERQRTMHGGSAKRHMDRRAS